ncbi:ParB/RepB/Spo0J family partition protein [Litoreibacter arenae]|uniref:Chromosome (Plasmid) partitioning protein ParB / Stage 0 sporulation protein J n=1 Tax=Litoreibacter arenae DSM 19593 TaxID=1123360 RepID=S9QCH0_9RHOB|nr:ParB/RepB/Spo0J family partition protein [Litoreibacter arenae]EPX77617.1 Chromosome (plasmid) partitioning protein ParB / Stage 0 sporulation protein J [Litoreibacter arenae DSM 19593]
MAEKRGLGRGLSALMADIETPDSPKSSGSERMIPIERIEPNPDQPRRDFVKEDLHELAESIRVKGIIQPLIVRPHPSISGKFEIVAGERRWRAAQIAQIHEVPVVVRQLDDTEVLEIAIIENIQRADLNPLEEAMGYRQLQDKFGHTQEQLSTALGKSRSHIANLMRLLNLPEDVIRLLRNGDLTSGHARALITTDNPSELARRVVKGGLSVRETERLAKSSGEPRKPKQRKPAVEKDPDTKALEGDLAATLKMGVSVDHIEGTEGGRLTITYKSFDQLDELCRLLAGN